MYSKDALTQPEAVSAVELFEQGLSAKSVAGALELAPNSVQMLHQRWQVRGTSALMTRDRKQYDLETKLLIVRRHLQGTSGRVLAKEYDLPSPGTVTNWRKSTDATVRMGYVRRKGADDRLHVRILSPESELEQLRRENERLRAEVGYLGKLRALRSRQGR